MGHKLQSIVSMAIKESYLNINENLIGDLKDVDNDNTILLVCDERERPYATINKIVTGNDKYINLRETDTFIFAEPTYDDTEKLEVKMQDLIAEKEAYSITIPKDKTILHHASKEDLMIMLNLLKPKYYMPVKGQYRLMVNNANLANSLGMSPDNIILKQNGDIVKIEDGKLLESFDRIEIDDYLIDGKSSDDIGELVIKDREMLSESGIMLVSATLDKNNKKILVGPEIATKGYIYYNDSEEMIKEIKRICLEIIEANITPNYVDYNNIRNEIREALSKYFYNETQVKPMVITVIQEV